jgi:pseudouridine synthase
LTHPKFHLDKTYVVKAHGKLSPGNQKKLEAGVVIENEKTAPCRISQVRYNDADTELQVTIHEGKKRQIRRMLWSVGHRVFFLKRISIGPLGLGDLTLASWRHLTQEEVERLKKFKL